MESTPQPEKKTPLTDADNMVAHRRGPWSQHEDRILVDLVNRNGPHNWVRISQEINTRSPKQCRERYHQNLKPTLNHEPISPEEGELIEKLVAEMGKRWAEIARRLKGRSDNAVKNWWNGGQNRRKRNPERDGQSYPHMHHSQAAYHYPTVAHSAHHEDDTTRSPSYLSYPPSRRSSFNPPMHSPHALKLPQPQGFDPYSGARPTPLQLTHPSHAVRAQGVETPMPSPSGYSNVSADGAPSLVTDTGSESRSPRGAGSPPDLTLAPLVGSREDRRHSYTRFLPPTGFANEDDDHYGPYSHRGSVQLPPIIKSDRTVTHLREPSSYRVERPQLLTQPAHQHVHHHSLPYSAPLPGQRSLPPFANLAEPSRAPALSPRNMSPPRQPLSPYARPAQPTETRSAPVSPKDKLKDTRMGVANLVN